MFLFSKHVEGVYLFTNTSCTLRSLTRVSKWYFLRCKRLISKVLLGVSFLQLRDYGGYGEEAQLLAKTSKLSGFV